MHELFFETRPFEQTGANNPVNIGIMVTQKGLRPIVPEESSAEYKSFSDEEKNYLRIMKQCWQHERSERPSFEEVHDNLTTILNKLM
jgi:hypothetical protein